MDQYDVEDKRRGGERQGGPQKRLPPVEHAAPGAKGYLVPKSQAPVPEAGGRISGGALERRPLLAGGVLPATALLLGGHAQYAQPGVKHL